MSFQSVFRRGFCAVSTDNVATLRPTRCPIESRSSAPNFSVQERSSDGSWNLKHDAGTELPERPIGVGSRIIDIARTMASSLECGCLLSAGNTEHRTGCAVSFFLGHVLQCTCRRFSTKRNMNDDSRVLLGQWRRGSGSACVVHPTNQMRHRFAFAAKR